MEQTLFQEKNVWIYQIPLLTGEPRADAWDIDKPLMTGVLKVLQTNDDCRVALYEPKETENVLFAECPIDVDAERPLTVFMQYCVDSSRYFVLRVVEPTSKRSAFVGIGFPERSSAFNFRAALEDFARYKQRLLLVASAPKKESKDLSLPQGATIHVQLGRKTQVSTQPKENKPPVDLSTIKFAPPPAYNPTAASAMSRLIRYLEGMSSRERIQVGVRCRPAFEHELTAQLRFVPALEFEKTMVHIVPQHSRQFSQRSFAFDYVWPENTTQEQVYEDAIASLVEKAVDGRSVTVLAYGQTGTGKTYTMGFLDATCTAELGVIPRVFEHLFRILDEKCSRIKMSFVQIYMECVHDLLVPPQSPRVDLPVRQDIDRSGFYVEGLEVYDVALLDDARGLVHLAMLNRTLAATSRNATSSRSHTLLTIYILDQENERQISKFCLVDLAGSERTVGGLLVPQATVATIADRELLKTRMNESKFINSSLSALGNVISSMASNNSKPSCSYRDSKLTKLLKGCIGERALTLVIATIDGAVGNLGETLSTLKFAARCRQVQAMKRSDCANHPSMRKTRSIATQTIESGNERELQLAQLYQKKEMELHVKYGLYHVYSKIHLDDISRATLQIAADS
ncbi:kinesin family member 3B [Thraustotheca clavata]|uniref:Kinesin-like protein n=1 Tax=Thraustotheca clavata TaxID=74557 RepID=A0A1V9Y7A8_9STRA|nr:kinesin family member 3B [Thraustotheca clavata]